MRTSVGVAGCCLAIALTACGGSGGSSPTGSVPATPTPSSTPTPTSTPLSYDMVREFSTDRSASAIGLRVLGRSQRGFTARLDSIDAQSSTIGFDFVAATRSYRVRYGNEQVEVQTEALPTTAEVGFSRDSYSDSDVAVTRTGFSNGLNYVGYLFWSGPRAGGMGTDVRERRLIFGSRTVATDIPTTGSATYQTDFDLPDLYNLYNGYRAVDQSVQPRSVTINWARRTVVAEFELTPAGYGTAGSSFRRITTVLTGAVGADGRITGTFDEGQGGTMEGAVYGPRGAEIGLVLVAKSGTDTVVAGVALGRQ